MCVYILFRKFLSLFRHFMRIDCWQDVCCEVLQAVSVGTVKNLSSQYIYTHALQVVDAHPAAGFGSPRYAGFNYGGCACRLCGCMCVYILFRKFLSLFRHFLWIGCWQDVGCEVLQAVSVGTVKICLRNIYAPMRCRVFSAPRGRYWYILRINLNIRK